MPRRTTSAPVTAQPAALPDTVPGCHELIHQLMHRLDAPEERANLNSRNSSKPPSSDDHPSSTPNALSI